MIVSCDNAVAVQSLHLYRVNLFIYKSFIPQGPAYIGMYVMFSGFPVLGEVGEAGNIHTIYIYIYFLYLYDPLYLSDLSLSL